MARHSYSLHRRFDIVAGGLVCCVALAGCLALSLTHRQRRDMQLLAAIQDQTRLVEELTRRGEGLVLEHRADEPLDAERVSAFHETRTRLAGNLRALRDGGQLHAGGNLALHTAPAQDPLMEQTLDAALTWVAPYGTLLDELIAASSAVAEDAAGRQHFQGLHRAFTDRGEELRTLIEAVVAQTESRSIDAIIRITQWHMVILLGALGLFVLWTVLMRRLVTSPLHRMADGIETMQTTGRLVKLPARHANELGVVADGFNQLGAQIEQQKQRLREHIVELQRVNAELDQLANVKDDFLQTVNHQLRTPMTAVLEGLALMRDGTLGALTADQQTFVQTMSENASRLYALIEQLLDLSLLKSGRRLLTRRPEDLLGVLRQTADSWQSTVGTRQTIRLAGEAPLPEVYMDREAVQEVLDQLLRNALRHAPEQSTVLISAEHHDGSVEVSVRDEGPGMSAEQLEQLFQPFVHIQTPDAPGSQGSGLGLAFCRQIIERHRGRVRADSEQGAGMTVAFSLPVASPAFLFTDACRSAQDEAQREHGQFGIVVATPPATDRADATMQQAELSLRKHTHRGDQFVRLDAQTLVIVAVTDQMGLAAMVRRLRQVLDGAQLPIQLGSAVWPVDSDTPERLLELARRRVGGSVEPAGATSGPKAVS